MVMTSKQVIVMRKDLNMRKGKMVAQGAHASMAVLLDMMTRSENRVLRDTIRGEIFGDYYAIRTFATPCQDPIDKWLLHSFTKICLGIDSEEELIKIYESARQADLPSALIEDSGLTEFHGVKTKTCCAIGPWWSDDIDLIIGELELL